MIAKQSEIYACSFNEVLLRTVDFWHMYREKYPEYKRAFLDKALFHEFKCIENIPDVLLEIYAYLDVLKKEKNHYNKILNFYMQYFSRPFDKQILEVGVGNCPSLAINLYKMIQSNNGVGSIIGYDPELVVKPDKIDLKKDVFTTSTDISNIDLLIGCYPCEATEIMLDRALGEHKELCLQLCGCVPEKYNDQISYGDWLNLLHEKILTHISSGYKYECYNLHINERPLITLTRK